jgi:hypothetical protein
MVPRPSTLDAMKEKSHKGQRHKGCGLCDMEKRAGNGKDRRPARDRRWIEHADGDAGQA